MFKKVIISGLFILFCLNIYGQNLQALKAGPLGFLIGNYNLRYERSIDANSSFQVGANYYDFKLFGISTSGFGIDGAYRYYFRKALNGTYVAPVVGLAFNRTLVEKNSTVKGNFSYLGIGATVGYQFEIKNNFIGDIGVGYGYNIELGKDDNLIANYNFAVPKFTLAIGYLFSNF